MVPYADGEKLEMTVRYSTVERAFQLARGGTCRTMGELRAALKSEKFDAIDSHLGGKSISKQLQETMRANGSKG